MTSISSVLSLFFKMHTPLSELDTQDALIPLNQMGLIEIAGLDARTFLQGQLTCDMESISDLKATYGGYANLQGRILATFICSYWNGRFILCMPRDVINQFCQTIKKYSVFSNVQIADVSDQFLLLGFAGEHVATLLEKQFTIPKQLLQCANNEWGHLINLSSTTPRFLTIVPRGHVEILLHNAANKLRLFSEDAWRLLTIRDGIVTIYGDTCAEFVAHRLNLHLINAISFTKGCYLGQEIIARTHYKSTPKHHLYYVRFDTTAQMHRGSNITQGERPIGVVVDFVEIPGYRTHALAILEIDKATNAEVSLEGVASQMTLCDLPYRLE